MPLHEELASLIEQRLPIHWIHGNHDADSNELWMRVWGSDLVDQSVHGRVVELADGTRLAGLGGVFRASVWYPDAKSAGPAFRTRAAHAKATPRQDRWGGSGTHRKHWGTIYPEEVDRLSRLRADILVTHEAPGGYKPDGVYKVSPFESPFSPSFVPKLPSTSIKWCAACAPTCPGTTRRAGGWKTCLALELERSTARVRRRDGSIASLVRTSATAARANLA